MQEWTRLKEYAADGRIKRASADREIADSSPMPKVPRKALVRP
jgi:hypothetical protein